MFRKSDVVRARPFWFCSVFDPRVGPGRERAMKPQRNLSFASHLPHKFCGKQKGLQASVRPKSLVQISLEEFSDWSEKLPARNTFTKYIARARFRKSLRVERLESSNSTRWLQSGEAGYERLERRLTGPRSRGKNER